MPVLSAGFMRAMHSWKQAPLEMIPPASQKNMEAIVTRCLKIGINHFETARGYGTSEIQLGQVLRRIPRGRFLVQTKVPPADDPQEFKWNVRDSLARMNLDRVDLLAIHGVNDYRSLWQVCRPGGCLHMARRLQQEGLAGHIGFSGHGSNEVILQAVRHEHDGGFDYLNLHWYYIQQENSPALVEAQARDMGVFIISPTDKGGMLHSPPDKLLTLCHPLTPIQFNDLYCLSRPEIHTISVGASVPDDFSEHVAALDHLDASSGLLSEIDKHLRKAMLERTGYDRPEESGAGLPGWQDIPGYINLRYIYWLWHLAQGWNLVEYGRRQYRKLGTEPKWVPGMNAAAAKQVDLTKVAAETGLNSSDLTRILQEAHALFGTGNGI